MSDVCKITEHPESIVTGLSGCDFDFYRIDDYNAAQFWAVESYIAGVAAGRKQAAAQLRAHAKRWRSADRASYDRMLIVAGAIEESSHAD